MNLLDYADNVGRKNENKLYKFFSYFNGMYSVSCYVNYIGWIYANSIRAQSYTNNLSIGTQ